ncbi:MAG: hypothetical protein WA303_17835, partial [Bradyrhizobium sp.]
RGNRGALHDRGLGSIFLYAVACVYFIGMKHAKAGPTALMLLSIWVFGAFGLWAAWLKWSQ